MKKVNKETHYNVIKSTAAQLGIKFVGVRKDDLIAAVNNKISEQEPLSTTKWYEVEGAYSFSKGEMVKIVGGKCLLGRTAKVEKPSSKKNAIKAFLLNDKTGTFQKTCITVDIENIEIVETQLPAVI